MAGDKTIVFTEIIRYVKLRSDCGFVIERHIKFFYKRNSVFDAEKSVGHDVCIVAVVKMIVRIELTISYSGVVARQNSLSNICADSVGEEVNKLRIGFDRQRKPVGA